MEKFNTIHIFGFGEVQLISKEKNGKVKISELSKLAALVDSIKGAKPENTADAPHHVIHIFSSGQIKYLGLAATPKTKASYSLPVSAIDATVFNEFVDEVVEKAESSTPK